MRLRFFYRLADGMLISLGAILLTIFYPARVAADELPQAASLPESGQVLRELPQPYRFFDATGRKAGVFGRQNGLFEAWIYPVKLLHNFRLEFQLAGHLESIRGETVLREVITRPESTTLVYVHPDFTVREIIWTPLNEPAVVIYFDVDATRALELTAGFVPDFKPMWPASFGGQHSYWLSEEKAFDITDGTQQPTALVGSPACSGYTEFTDHQLAAGEMLMRMHITPDQSSSISTPLVMALSMESEANARALYRSVLERARGLFEERVEYHRKFLERTLSFESPDPELNRDFTWAKIALDSGWVCHPIQGCGLIAGYGPSGVGERPGFAWWFGGDALMASWALEDYGDLPGALQALRFLKDRQRADGKMMHEMTQSVDLLDWFGKYHYAYYHADTTPMYLYSVGQYWRRTGDRKFLEEFWTSAKKAYAYCVSTVTPEDGLMDNTKAGLAAVEVGVLRGKVVKDVYLEGFWVAALEAVAEMANISGEKDLSSDATLRAAKTQDSLKKDWWSPEQHSFAFGVTADGHRTDLLGAWPSVLLALSERVDPKQAALAAESFATPDLSTDWGVRWLTNESPLYDPLSYNNGTAWPFMSGIAAWAQYRHEQPLAGFATWSGIARLTSLSSPGMLPELMNGDRYLPGEFAVPHQLFSSVGVIVPAVRGLLGLETRGIANGSDAGIQVSFAPNLPADWPFLRFQRYAIAKGSLSGEVSQLPERTTIHLQYQGSSPVAMNLAPALPVLSRVKSVRIDGKPQKFSIHESGSFLRVEVPQVALRPSQQLTLSVEYDGGIAIVPPRPQPEPGKRTSSLKILDVQSDAQNHGCLVRLTLAGLGGRTYQLKVVSSLPQLRADGLPVRKTQSGYEIEIPFDSANYVTRQVCLSD